MSVIEVKVYANAPVFISANPDDIGKLFAHMNDEEQVAVLAAMELHMRPHRMQWDYISIWLSKAENREVRDALYQALFPEDAA